MEGTAVYGAREAMIAAGERSAAETERSIREEGGYRRDLVALEAFCAEVGRGGDWRAAFASDFASRRPLSTRSSPPGASRRTDLHD